eukprot:CAMPEP_0113554308 /NCGR_PEP_ID=MMETSP0015_2-20120614/16078_1 /TAXON_ID=2838 /ORGANISM="Odontella" /LENGTH=285 /DNA_ID=CAMNT_0000455437 /DNA_START=197 /DNA_END=1054 /DNA_ORIENTATION=+ /assembly_acc=CAM_ASM_000160
MEVQNDGGSVSADENIQIYKPQAGTFEKIPESPTLAWPTWVLYADKKESKLVRIPDDRGFLNPVSGEELFQPLDLIEPEMRLALGLHIREGAIRQIMPAVDLSFRRVHHNRGLSSVPRARQWVDFVNIDWSEFGMVIMQRKLKDGDNSLEVISAGNPVKPYIDHAIKYLVENPPDEWSKGSQIVHVVLDDEVSKRMEGIKTGHELVVALSQGTDVRGQLSVKVKATEAGSQSAFLPEVYRDLFFDKTYQRKKYFDFLKRKAERAEKLKADASQSVREAREKQNND